MGTRKPNLRSSIFEGPADRWHGWVTVGVNNDGSPDRRHRSAATQTEVTRKVRELERKRDSGGAGKAGRALFVADSARQAPARPPPAEAPGRLLHVACPSGPQAQYRGPDPPDRVARPEGGLEARQGGQQYRCPR
jgi:hypothetical protein